MDNISTEAIFYSSSYTTKSGWKITIQLPDETAAKALDAIGAGQRYMLALVPIADDETPDVDAMQKVRKSRAQMAGILCNDERFWRFVGQHDTNDWGGPLGNNEVADFVRTYCQVESRAEIKEGTIAARLFDVLRTEFDVFTGRIASPN